ncbi:MAG: DUF2157 domain-containing protein [archaeon]
MALNSKLKNWLKNEVLSWRKKGIISEQQTTRILNQYSISYEPPKSEPVNVIKVLSIIGAVLLGLGVILFVAANWDKIPDTIKTLMLLVVTFGTFYLGYHFSYQGTGLPNLGKTLMFLSTMFYGGSVFLISQTYNITANSHWLVLMWAASILPVAYFFSSMPAYILTSILFVIWDGLFTFKTEIPNYFYPVIMFAILIPMAKGKEELNIANYFGLGIAQAYALANQSHWLVLLWALGALAYYIMKQKQIYLIMLSILFIIWDISLFTIYADFPNYIYILPLIGLFYLSNRDRSLAVFAINVFGFLIWINLFIYSLAQISLVEKYQLLPIAILQSFIGLTLYALGIYHKAIKHPFALILQLFGFIITTLVAYILSFKAILEEFSKSDFHVYFFSSVVFCAINIIVITATQFKGGFSTKSGRLELLPIIAISAVNLFVLFVPNPFFATILMNLALFVLSIVAVLYGFESHNAVVFNIGVFMFVAFIVTRYFDVFWRLLPRSLFFIVGGTLMIIGSIFLEKKRRKTLAEM